MALGATSPAADAAVGACLPPATDQRGFPRNVGTCDLGAYERGSTLPDTTLPICAVVGVLAANPKQMDVPAQDLRSGLQAITDPMSTNGTVVVHYFTPGTTLPVVLAAVKTNQSLSTSMSRVSTTTTRSALIGLARRIGARGREKGCQPQRLGGRCVLEGAEGAARDLRPKRQSVARGDIDRLLWAVGEARRLRLAATAAPPVERFNADADGAAPGEEATTVDLVVTAPPTLEATDPRLAAGRL